MAKPRCSHLLASWDTVGAGDVSGGGILSVRSLSVKKLCPFPGPVVSSLSSIAPNCPEPLIRGCETSKKAKQGPSLSSSTPWQVSSAPPSWLAPASVVS